jgi:hypothetical protein
MSYHPYHMTTPNKGYAAAIQPRSTAGTPSGCVRGSPDYTTLSDCMDGKSGAQICVPRYINGAWDRYTPYARDTNACVGAEPPNLVPQSLDDASLIESHGWMPLSGMGLTLMSNGHIGVLTFRVDGGQSQSITFDQASLENELDKPLMYVYSVVYGTGRARLSLNLTSGQATITFPLGNGAATIRYLMSTF